MGLGTEMHDLRQRHCLISAPTHPKKRVATDEAIAPERTLAARHDKAHPDAQLGSSGMIDAGSEAAKCTAEHFWWSVAAGW